MKSLLSAFRSQNLVRTYSTVSSQFKADSRPIGLQTIDGFVDCASESYQQRYAANKSLQHSIDDVLRAFRQGGSERSIKRQRQQKKLLVRERLERLLDPGSEFFEFGELAGWNMDYGDIPSAGSINGIGRVAGRLCMIAGIDSTVKGGTIYPIGLKKNLRAQEMSLKLRLPCIFLVDSGGAYLPLQSEIFLPGGRTFYNEAVLGSHGIPQIAIVCGNCTAGGAYTPTMADDCVIVHKIGSLFLGGPPLVKAATGEVVSVEDLGGADLHCRESGGSDYMAMDEASALKACRDIVTTLGPFQNSPLMRDSADIEPVYSQIELRGVAGDETPGRGVVDQVLARILDKSEFFEFRQLYGSHIVCGFGLLGKRLIGVLAGEGSAIDYKSAQKACQLVQMCDQRNIPLVVLQRTLHDGWPSADHAALKAQAQLMTALANGRMQKISLNIGSSYGSDYLVMCGRSFDPEYYLTWPNAGIGMTKPSSDNQELLNETSALYAASRLWVDGVVAPEKTRKVLLQCLETFRPPSATDISDKSSAQYILRF